MTDHEYSALRKDMQLWRAGYAPLPQAYIDVHEEAARADLPRFCEKHGLTLIASMMCRSGWADGVKSLHFTACVKGCIGQFQWSDSNGGSWFVAQRSGGALLVEIAPNGPGYL